MIFELLGHLLLATTFAQVLPTDAADLATTAGYESLAHSFASVRTSQPTLPQAAERIRPPTKVDLDSYGILTNAASAIVIDDASGEVLFAKRPDEQRALGSITKLMSVLVFLDTQPDLKQRVTLLGEDYVAGGRVYLRFDDEVDLHDVLRASLVGSDNTATQSLARLSGLGTEEFVARMNAKARTLGMTSSYFVDPSGIGGDNVTTARDVARLLQAAAAQPTLADIMPRQEVTIVQASGYEVTVTSTNELLGTSLDVGDFDIVAGKTGYIPQAGYCLAATIAHEGHRLRIVVLGADTKTGRFSDVKGLATWAFQTYSWE